MAFSGSPKAAPPSIAAQSNLFYQRFHRKYDQRMLKLLQDHSVPPSSRTEGRDRLDRSDILSSTRKEYTDSNSPLLTPMIQRPRLNMYAQILSGATARGRNGGRKKRTAGGEGCAGRRRESDKGLAGVAHIVNELKTMFEKMPRAALKLDSEPRLTPETAVSPQNNPIEILSFPRISQSTTPHRAQKDPLMTQRRPKPPPRRVKDQVDMVGLQQYFTDFHLKSRNLLQQLEANVIGK